jgi:hypothetical protein
MEIDGLNRRIAELRGEAQYSVYEPVGKLLSWPAYASDWAAAGPLLDDMLRAMRAFGLYVHIDRIGRATAYVLEDSDGKGMGKGETLPEAIARTWLEWKEYHDVGNVARVIGDR